MRKTVKFNVIAGLSAGLSFEVGERAVEIGREQGRDVVLDDDRVSRLHARIEPREGQLFIRDMGSSNGTYVNDRLITEVALKEGDVIAMGNTQILVGELDASRHTFGIPPRRGRYVMPSPAEAVAGETTAILPTPESERISGAKTVVQSPAPHPTYWREIIATAVDSVRPLADEKNVEIRFSHQGELGEIPVPSEILYPALVTLIAKGVEVLTGRRPILRIIISSAQEEVVIHAFIEDGGVNMEMLRNAAMSPELVEAMAPVRRQGGKLELPGTSTSEIFVLRFPGRGEPRGG